MKRIQLLWILIITSSLSLRAQDSLRTKIGQMIIVGFIGESIPDSLYADLTSRNLGGVVLSGANGNLTNPIQIRQLTDALRAASTTAPFIAVDQEGGRVARLNASNGFAATSTAYTLGTTFASIDSTTRQAETMASWLEACGMNLNFAPVIDVNVNPLSPAIGYYERSFSALSSVVASHARAFISPFHRRGIMTTSKHFPGHGSATNDSHLTLPDITDTWTPDELVPYRELIQTSDIDLVMVGHLFNATIDSVYPSSLSHSTISGILRDSLSFDGPVLTDAMGMGAITNTYGFWQAAVLSVNAGTDILLYTTNVRNGASLARQLIDTLAERVKDGSIVESRITEAYERIVALKQQYLLSKVGQPLALSVNVPNVIRLENYPNPFNPSTILRVGIPSVSTVRMEIFDALGRMVELLFEGEMQAGTFELRWTPKGAAGIYFCRTTAVSHSGGELRQAVTRLAYLR